MNKYNSLDEIGDDYISATQDETEAMFRQGEVVMSAIQQGCRVKDVVYHCASLTRRKARTVFLRYAVAKTFPDDQRNPELDWTMHSICAATDNPHKWLEIASEGYIDANGEHKGHTSRTLKAAIKAAGGDPDKDKPQMLLDSVAAVVTDCSDCEPSYMRLEFAGDFKLPAPIVPGMVIQITAVYAPAPELENVA